MLYCSRCARAIPPGGLDEGRYYTVGKEIICPKCYRGLKPGQHTGGTIAGAHPIEERLRMPGSRVGPAVKPGSRVGPAARPPTTRVGPAAHPSKPPTRSLPAARRGRASSSSTRLVAIKTADARLKFYAIGLVVLAIFLGLLLLMFYASGHKARAAAPAPAPTPAPTADHGKPPPSEPDNFRRPAGTQTPPPERTPTPPAGGGLKPGLKAQYYLFAENDKADFLPADHRKKPSGERVDAQVNFELSDGQLGRSGFSDKFCAVWSGFIRVEKAGSHKFFLNSDDGSKLTVDGRVVVDNGGCHEAAEKDGAVELAAGDHAITVEYFENTGPACCILSWEPPGGKKEAVPAEVLFHK